MDHTFCMTIITALGGTVVAVSTTLWRILLWYKKESEGRLADARSLAKLVGDGDETKVK